MDEHTRRQRQVLERLAREISRRGMTAPAIFVFESVQPLSLVAGQALAFIEPMVRVLLEVPDYEVFREAIEDRGNLRWLVDRLEELSDDPDAPPPPGLDPA
ncbi:MAG TPA: hypothetical protein VM283_01425 [Armatimonadota bacterium]|nr:hypothetical protein [Armatimonadota bacterium]